MKKYEQYKDSGVAWIGEIPSHWKVERLKHNSAFINGFAFNSEDFQTDAAGVRVIRIGDIGDKVDFDNCIRATTDPQLLTPYLIKDGDLLIAMSGATTGKCCIADNIKTAYINQRVGIIRSDMHKMIYYSLQTPYFKEYVNLNNAGSAQPNISSNAIGEFPIMVMPMEEQQAIVRFLDYKVAKIDQLITESEAQIEELGKYKTAFISEVVTKGLNPDAPMRDSGIEWIGQIPEHWELLPLKRCLSSQLMYGANEVAESDNSAYPRYIRITDIGENNTLRSDTIKTLSPEAAKDYMLKDGDLLFARSGATVGKTYLYRGGFDACFAGYLIKASFNSRMIPMYAYYFTQTSSYDSWKNQVFIQATIQNIGADKYSMLPICVPPIEEQKNIVNDIELRVVNYNTLIENLYCHIKQLQAYKTALISEAVTGQIDVRDWQEK